MENKNLHYILGCCRSRILRNVTAKSENFKISQVSHF